MKKNAIKLFLFTIALLISPRLASAAGVSVSGGSLKYPNDTSTVTITASGTTFNAFQGTISASGTVRITSCSAGSALWVTQPTGAGAFVGALTSSASSFRIATCSIKASSVGTGSVSVSGVQLANSGPIVGTDGGSVSFNIVRQPTPPGTVTVTSSSHPDQNTAYEATTIVLSWSATGTSGYAYLLDQVADTTPGTTTDNNTTATYADKAVGTYYFHIRAKNGDGWGPTAHFKITIKEPDPKINESLGKPHNILVKKLANYTNNIADSTFTGFSISGVTEPNYVANIKLTPLPTLPEGKVLSIKSDSTGKFEYIFDFPIPAGLYKLSTQGQDNKTLTPLSDEIKFEISQAKGGSVNMLSDDDRLAPVTPVLKWYQKSVSVKKIIYAIAGLAALAIAIVFIIRRRKRG